MDIEALAKKVAEYANTCCYRSDGFEEDTLKVAREAILDAVAAEREACAKVCRNKKPWGNSADDWAAELLEEAASDIEKRSNAEITGSALIDGLGPVFR